MRGKIYFTNYILFAGAGFEIISCKIVASQSLSRKSKTPLLLKNCSNRYFLLFDFGSLPISLRQWLLCTIPQTQRALIATKSEHGYCCCSDLYVCATQQCEFAQNCLGISRRKTMVGIRGNASSIITPGS